MTSKKLSFDITTPHQFFDKLIVEQKSVEANLTSARHAINAAMTAWHLLEWVWGDAVKGNNNVRKKLGEPSKNIDAFRNFVLKQCPEMETMQCICEGSKHVGGTKGSRVSSTSVHQGKFSKAYGKGFNRPRLRVENINGSIRYFDNELEAVINFWTNFFRKYLG